MLQKNFSNPVDNILVHNIEKKLLYHPYLYYNTLICINLNFFFIIYIGNKYNVVHRVILFFVKYLPIKYNLMAKNFIHFLPNATFSRSKYSGNLLKKKTNTFKLPKTIDKVKSFRKFYKFFIKYFIFWENFLDFNIQSIVLKNIKVKSNIVESSANLTRVFFKKKKYIQNNYFLPNNLNVKLTRPLWFKYDEFLTYLEVKQEYLACFKAYKYRYKFFKKKNKPNYKFYRYLYQNFFFYPTFDAKFIKTSFFLKRKNLRSVKTIKFFRKKFKFKIKKYALQTSLTRLKIKVKKLLQFFILNTLNIKTFNLADLFLKVYTKKNAYKIRKKFNKKLKAKKSKKFLNFKKNWYRNLLVYSKSLLKVTFNRQLNFTKLNKFSLLKFRVNNSSKISINSRIFINKNLIREHILKFYNKSLKTSSFLKKNKFYKFNTTTKSIIFLNLNISLLGKLRRARKVHWNLHKTGKLNERRYQNYLKKSVNLISKNFKKNGLLILFFQLFNRVISWRHANDLLNLQLFLVNGAILLSKEITLASGDLVETPVGLGVSVFYRWYKFNFKKYYNRVKRWAHLNYCQYLNPKLKKKKNIPKILKKLPIFFKFSNHLFLVDHSLSCAVVSPGFENNKKQIFKDIEFSTILKLYNWRYKA